MRYGDPTYYIAAFADALKPEPLLTVTEWANQKRVLSETSALPGRYSSSVTPYLEEIMQRLSASDPAQLIIFKKSAQVGATEAGNNWLGYTIDIDPCSMLYVMPTDTMMKDVSRTRIDKMIEDTPALKGKISPKKSRDGNNTILSKEFLRGRVKMVGANSPVGLSGTPVKKVYLDEIARYPKNVGGEGSALKLAYKRTITFGARKKIFITSTPSGDAETSEIGIEFEKTGQRYRHLPCPYCGAFQILTVDQLRYGTGTNKYKDVTYECVECHELIDERHKKTMLPGGKWIPKYPEREDGTVYGYFINALHSPLGFFSWGELLKERDEAKGDLPKEIAYVNTSLGEEYRDERAQKLDWELLYNRYNNPANEYEKNKPFASVVFLTAGVDVQGDRLEVVICGWQPGHQCQVIDYRVLPGKTNEPDVWRELDKILEETWLSEENKELRIKLMAVDSNFNTQTVYDYVNKKLDGRVVAVRGRDTLNMIWAPPKTNVFNKNGKPVARAKVYNLGVSVIKTSVYGRLGLSIDRESGEIPEGYMYIPAFGETYFRGLVAEEVQIVTNKKGQDVYQWVKKYARNEPLDTMVYARAAASIAGLERWTAKQWADEYAKLVSMEEKQLPPKPKVKKKSVWDR